MKNLEFIDLRDARDDALLQAFYERLYLPAFPIASERESPAVWVPRLWEHSARDDRFELHALLATDGLRTSPSTLIAGGLLFEYYFDSACGLLTYLTVALPFRRRGLGRQLLTMATAVLKRAATANQRELLAVFGEANDPTRVAAESDSMDPRARFEALRRLGGRIVDVPYVQPELEPGQGCARDLMLLAFPIDDPPRVTIPARTVIAFLDNFYRATGINEPRHEPNFDRMLRSITGEDIPLRDDWTERTTSG